MLAARERLRKLAGFPVQDLYFALSAPAILPSLAGCPHHPMARDDIGKGVGGNRSANRACRARVTQRSRELTVCSDLTEGNIHEGLPDQKLKWAPSEHETWAGLRALRLCVAEGRAKYAAHEFVGFLVGRSECAAGVAVT